MFFVRVVAMLGGIILEIHAACGFRTGKISGADSLGDDDLRNRGGRVADGVASDFSRHVEIWEINPWRGDFFKPPHRQELIGGLGINRNDCSLICSLQAYDEGIQIALRIISGSAGDIAGIFVTSRLDESTTYRSRRIDRRRGVRFDRVGQGRLVSDGEIIQQDRMIA